MPDSGTPNTGLSARIAIVAVLLPNLVAILRSWGDLEHLLIDKLGPRWISVMVATSLAVLVLGYLLGAWVLYGKLATRLSLRMKLILGPLGLIALGIVGAYSAHALDPEPTPLYRAELEKWADNLISAKGKQGGMRDSLRDSDSTEQVFTTAQGLVALLSVSEAAERHADSIRSAVQFIEDSRRSEPQPGWGYWKQSPATVTEISAWVSLAKIASLKNKQLWEQTSRAKRLEEVERDLDDLVHTRVVGGGFTPFAFERPAAAYTRTYSTLMALWAMVELRAHSAFQPKLDKKYLAECEEAVKWLLNRHESKGWVPNPHRRQQGETYPGLSAQVLYVLNRAEQNPDFAFLKGNSIYKEAKLSFIRDEDFAKLSAASDSRMGSEDQHFPQAGGTEEGSTFQCQQLEGMTFLWYPWALLTYKRLSEDESLLQSDRELARRRYDGLYNQHTIAIEQAEHGATYRLAESLFGLATALKERPPGSVPEQK